MESWRARALELLPEVDPRCECIDSPMMLWIEIRSPFERAYEEPRNEDFIRRVYEYAFWCLEHGDDSVADAREHLPTCVAVAFYEDLPTHPATRADMPRWFTRQEVLGMREIFSYMIGASDYDKLRELFPVERSNRAARREARKRNRQPRPWAKPSG